MGDPVSASEYYQLHNSFTKKLLDSKSPLLYISYSMLLSDVMGYSMVTRRKHCITVNFFLPCHKQFSSSINGTYAVHDGKARCNTKNIQ